jgi:hypothetical protein
VYKIFEFDMGGLILSGCLLRDLAHEPSSMRRKSRVMFEHSAGPFVSSTEENSKNVDVAHCSDLWSTFNEYSRGCKGPARPNPRKSDGIIESRRNSQHSVNLSLSLSTYLSTYLFSFQWGEHVGTRPPVRPHGACASSVAASSTSRSN